MKKLDRLVEKLIVDASMTVVERRKVSGHMHFILRLPSGEVRKLTTANTPRNLEHTLRAVERDLRRMV